MLQRLLNQINLKGKAKEINVNTDMVKMMVTRKQSDNMNKFNYKPTRQDKGSQNIQIFTMKRKNIHWCQRMWQLWAVLKFGEI